MWIETRRRSTSRLSRVTGLTRVSGYEYEYWTGLCAAPLMGLLGVTLNGQKINISHFKLLLYYKGQEFVNHVACRLLSLKGKPSPNVN